MTTWTEEMDALLKTMRAQGHSFSVCAKACSATGFKVSRNAAIGRAGRLGLNDESKAVKRQRNEQRAKIAAAQKQRAAAPKLLPVKPLPERQVSRDPSLFVSFIDRKKGQCPFPVLGEGPSMLVCGAQVSRGAYCEGCARIAYPPAAVKARVFARDAA